MRLIFLNRFYWPETPATGQLLADLAEALAARGHHVTVITSRPDRSATPHTEVYRDVHIIRVNATRWGRTHLAARPADFVTFLVGMTWNLAQIVRPGDWVIAMTDPPLLGVAAWSVARLKGARLLHWAQDIYPEVASVVGGSRIWSLLTPILRPLRNVAWQRSEGCVTVGRDMAALIAQNGVPREKIHVIANWAPAGLETRPHAAANYLRTTWGLQTKFVVAYAGNLGRVHDLDPIIEVAAALRSEATIAFVFIGTGAHRHALEKAVQTRGLTNVYFKPSQPRELLGPTLAGGDLHWVTLRAGCERVVFPSKLYGIAAVGRPVLVIAPAHSELARLVTERNFGFAFTRGDITAMAGTIRELAADPRRCAQLGAAAMEFSHNQGRCEHAITAWEALFAGEAACSGDRSGSTLACQ